MGLVLLFALTSKDNFFDDSKAFKMPVVNDKEREEIAQENVKKLHRMVLGEDKNINNDYVENFYVDMAKILSEYFPKAEDRKNARVLDLAAGTGLVGQDLYKEGFTNIDGVDFSEAMLVELRKKNVYTKDYCGRLGDNTDPICGIPDGSYDVVVIAGGFAHGHLNIQVLRQAARALKKGGLFVNAMSEKYTKIVPELGGLDPLIWKMEEEKVWKYVLRLIHESKWPGLFQVCRKL